MGSHRFEPSCPDDVIPFIKPCLEFNQNGHLFPCFCGIDQVLDHRGIASNTVKRHLHCKNLRVLRRSLNQCFYGIKGLIWMMQQVIPVSDPFEQLFRRKSFKKNRREKRFVFQLG